MSNQQNALRNELCATLIAALTSNRVTQIEAVVACMGAKEIRSGAFDREVAGT
jgi:hypothetical protein